MTAQFLRIDGWHPTSSPNAQNHHWRTRQKRHHADRDMAWASAKHAGWDFVQGRVRLTITLVYPRKYRVDADNMVARCKGLIDGLKSQSIARKQARYEIVEQRGGFFTDDSTEWLDLRVEAVVEPGVKATRLTLEPAA